MIDCCFTAKVIPMLNQLVKFTFYKLQIWIKQIGITILVIKILYNDKI